MKFKVHGANRNSGNEVTVTVEASSPESAMNIANRDAILVSRVESESQPRSTKHVIAATLVVAVALAFISMAVVSIFSRDTTQTSLATAPPQAEPRFQGETLSVWIERTKDFDRKTELQAISAIEGMGQEAGQRGIDAVQILVESKDPAVQLAAAEAVWTLTQDCTKLYESLVAAVEGTSSQTVEWRTRALILLARVSTECLAESEHPKGSPAETKSNKNKLSVIVAAQKLRLWLYQKENEQELGSNSERLAEIQLKIDILRFCMSVPK